MSALQSTIPTEALNGCILRQLFHGKPRLVFVEHERPGCPGRACFEVERDGPGGYKPTGPRKQWHGEPGTDAAELCAEYLRSIV